MELISQRLPKEIWRPLSVGNVVSGEHSVDHEKHSKYSGPPTVENTKAWEDLVQPTFFGATEQELVRGKESIDDSVQLADSDGYLAALGVYHELHCLRQLRLHLYKDTYYSNLTQANIDWFYGHLDHCIETLRISIMCQADLSLYTFSWKTSHDNRPNSKSNAKRQCVNWDEVEEWSMKRRVSLWPRLLRKNGKKDIIHL
ncbi:hypothetical protein B0J11DRAFT_300685 [Dendryphion nanum]|uniref:Tat pathway signal sequence protein n=1 Tax=Dendryphion nanum TaxID=256645 RepID=A0A9P9ILY2_9PLEO|nr:hypothetical protein B0J11DRAFT_300685 [Dendryphion nanum]